jgi:hypothetical protein
MGDVTFSEALRQQFFHRRQEKSCRQLPEEATSLTIGVPNDTLPIYNEERVG